MLFAAGVLLVVGLWLLIHSYRRRRAARFEAVLRRLPLPLPPQRLAKGQRVRFNPAAKAAFSPAEPWPPDPVGVWTVEGTAEVMGQRFVEIGKRLWDERLWDPVP